MKTKVAIMFLIACYLCACGQIGRVEPTSTPSPTVDPDHLRFASIPEQIAFQAEGFMPIDMKGYLLYRNDTTLQDICTWSVTGSEHLSATMTGSVLFVEAVTQDWYGSENISIIACDESGVCIEGEVLFSRLEESADNVTRVLFIGNDGFLISSGGMKVLIDSPLSAGQKDSSIPVYALEPIVSAALPFDDIDLILITHDHADHYDADAIRTYMQQNTHVMLVSTSQVASHFTDLSERIITVDPVKGEPVFIEANGIQVEAIYLSHGTPPAGRQETFNNGYVVTMGDLRFFHSGDLSSLNNVYAYGLSEMGIDLLFLPYDFLTRQIDQRIAPQYVFPMHYQFEFDYHDFSENAVLVAYPDAIFFHTELESWIMP